MTFVSNHPSRVSAKYIRFLQFLLPCCMECRRGLAMRILNSVCPYVRLSRPHMTYNVLVGR